MLVQLKVTSQMLFLNIKTVVTQEKITQQGILCGLLPAQKQQLT